MRDTIAGVTRPSMLLTINSMLDELPRTRVGTLGREAPAFRTCGVAGFYVAVVVLFGAGLMTGRSLPVLAIIMLVSGLSFFAYTYLRRWITGVERLVLLEHVWFALGVNAGVLWLMRQPVLPYLDVISVALCPFLAAGRVGCTLVGCCHGNPSDLGIRYSAAAANDGFERYLVGVRLLPVPAIEAVGLLIIGLTGALALPFAASGKVFAWYLLSYSVMRFGLEGLRGDVRPHWLGLSQARWMSIAEVMVAVHLAGDATIAVQAAADAVLLLTLFATLLYLQRRNARRMLLAPKHVAELRAAFAAEAETFAWRTATTPTVYRTSSGTTIAVSAAAADRDRGDHAFAHVSVALPPSVRDLRLLVDVVAAAFPDLAANHAELTRGHLLHMRVPIASLGEDSTLLERRDCADTLYGVLVRCAQRESETAALDGSARNVEPSAMTTIVVASDLSPRDAFVQATCFEKDGGYGSGNGNGNGSANGNGTGHIRQRYFASASSRAP